ncbi:MAG: MMPL family transporter [Planctomycetaceae bacterium]|nr:MMPL family transporter [Planctomycetaceae bacterium]
MKKPFLARRLPFFGSVAMFVLCLIFFLVPFFARSARFAVDDVRNDVSDWLPDHFIETQQLKEFRDYFLGEQFVLVSWDGCNEDDRNFQTLVKMLRRESLAHSEAVTDEEKEAHRLGDEYAWHYADDYHENVGSGHERWFKGKNGKWFYITQEGKVYKWLGESDLLGTLGRFVEQQWSGSYKLQGEHIATFGSPTNNEFYRDPRKLFARLFKDVQTGPDFLQQLAGEKGSLNIANVSSESVLRLQAKIEAHQRLTGAFFGPTPSKEFNWTPEKMRAELSEQRLAMLQPGWEEELGLFVQDLIATEYGGNADKFHKATQEQRLRDWIKWWDRINLPMPPRQTAIMVTLNGPVIDDFSMVVGRGLLGKPRGRILELATGECGISPDSLHIGGPPVDNVSIDEEGSITLMRLASLSGIIGISISLLSFRSLRVTLMLFFVGGVSALSSLGVVWMLGGGLDAILMTMPSLVYVLAISGSVHVINYYRDACEETGRRTAVTEAVKHAIFPCTVAAFTTALGLFSLCTSNLAPIFKFGYYSGIAVVGTLALMFTYLPASLEVFPPNFARGHKTAKPSMLMNWVENFWIWVGRWVTRYHWAVNVSIILIMVVVGYGVLNVQTSVQLLKLFQPEAKILKDYRWFESHLGKLVPMEILVRFQDEAIEPFTPRREAPTTSETEIQQVAYQEPSATEQEVSAEKIHYQYTLRDRLELVRQIRRNLETVFGPQGQDIIGSGMSIDVFTPDLDSSAMDMVLERDFDRLPRDFLYSPRMLPRPGQTRDLGTDELWRISLRLGAFSDVDYGRFVNEIKQVVEPSMQAALFRNQLFRQLESRFAFGKGDDEQQFNILFISDYTPNTSVALGAPAVGKEGIDSQTNGETPSPASKHQEATLGSAANQSAIFSQTLRELLLRKGFEAKNPKADSTRCLSWFSAQSLAEQGAFTDQEKLANLLKKFAVVVVIDPHADLDIAALRSRDDVVVLDASNCYQYRIDPINKNPLEGQLTAEQILTQNSGEEEDVKATPVDISAVYTGVIPIVYKAQRTLLASLFESIFYSFLMITLVMGLLLRPWNEPWRIGNLINFRGGVLSMLPNVFPLIVVFGMMGHLAEYDIKVDIGSMMTASVAMGIAVDDTIHFLTWYRQALADGATKKEAIDLGYSRCAKAMTQTTMIAGLGLFAFAFSSFTPTQRFGTLMLLLLTVALIGDLVFLPALISSPWGRYFGKELSPEERAKLAEKKRRETRVTNPDNIVKSLEANLVVTQTPGPHSMTSRGSVTPSS